MRKMSSRFYYNKSLKNVIKLSLLYGLPAFEMQAYYVIRGTSGELLPISESRIKISSELNVLQV